MTNEEKENMIKELEEKEYFYAYENSMYNFWENSLSYAGDIVKFDTKNITGYDLFEGTFDYSGGINGFNRYGLIHYGKTWAFELEEIIEEEV